MYAAPTAGHTVRNANVTHEVGMADHGEARPQCWSPLSARLSSVTTGA